MADQPPGDRPYPPPNRRCGDLKALDALLEKADLQRRADLQTREVNLTVATDGAGKPAASMVDVGGS